jgi:hypothetical protein
VSITDLRWPVSGPTAAYSVRSTKDPDKEKGSFTAENLRSRGRCAGSIGTKTSEESSFLSHPTLQLPAYPCIPKGLSPGHFGDPGHLIPLTSYELWSQSMGDIH